MSIHVIARRSYLKPWWIVFLPRLKGVSVIRSRIRNMKNLEQYLNYHHNQIMARVRKAVMGRVIFGGDPNTRVEKPGDSV